MPPPLHRLAAAVLALLVVSVVLPRAAAAHTEVQRAEPPPGGEATAPVDRVRLTFLDPVRPGTTLVVSDGSGQPVPGLTDVEESGDGRTATVRFDPLTGGGGYVVEYRFTAEDGDVQVESYRFTLRAAARAAGEDGVRTDAAGVGAAAVFLATVLVAAATAVVRRNRTPPGVGTSDPS